MYRLPRRMIEQTFNTLRSCGAGLRECQLYWVSPWDSPATLTQVVHPRHQASGFGLSIEGTWISAFWNELADRGLGVRIQVHTHPETAFHSDTDDSFPLLHEIGFLSLVIPYFASGTVGFEGAYLTEIQPDGSWQQVEISSRISIHEHD